MLEIVHGGSHLARLSGGPAPRRLPVQLVELLRRAGASYALSRLRTETALADQLRADLDVLDGRFYHFGELATALRGDIDTAASGGRGGRIAASDAGLPS